MIQELFNGNVGIIGGERTNLSPSCVNRSSLLENSPSHTSSQLSSTPASATTNILTSTTPTTPENLRCPRCDSSNTKFCYYNNYNLTQPRHFCKTCRRYWTKGGALRNVPIGGGCRKNKSAIISSAVTKSNSAGKMKTASPDTYSNQMMSKSGLFSCFENADHNQMVSQNPILWAQNSHLLSLLRPNPNPNPNNHMQSSVSMKDEAGSMFGSSYLGLESAFTNGLTSRALGFDNLGPMHVIPSTGLSNSIYRNQADQPGQASGFVLGEAQSNGLQELYQRLRSSSSSTSCYPDHTPVIPGNHVGASTSTTCSGILESAPVGTGDQLGFWNSTLTWPTHDLATTTNGAAYP